MYKRQRTILILTLHGTMFTRTPHIRDFRHKFSSAISWQPTMWMDRLSFGFDKLRGGSEKYRALRFSIVTANALPIRMTAPCPDRKNWKLEVGALGKYLRGKGNTPRREFYVIAYSRFSYSAVSDMTWEISGF